MTLSLTEGNRNTFLIMMHGTVFVMSQCNYKLSPGIQESTALFLCCRVGR